MRYGVTFLAGFVLASLLFSGAWWFTSKNGRQHVEQIAFDSQAWKTGDASLRGKMVKDLVRYLEMNRPNENSIPALLGPSGYQNSAYLNGADLYYVYQIDGGQRISGMPYLNKIGLAFHKDGSYSHTNIWD